MRDLSHLGLPAAMASPVTSSAADLPELAGYRTVNVAAVASLLLGLAAFLVWVSPVLGLIAIAGVVVSVLALRQFAAEPERYAGRPLAVAGLCLSMLFLGAGAARSYVRQSTFFALSEQFARNWIQLVEAGQILEAHQLRQYPDRRAAVGTDLAAYYKAHDEVQKDLVAFETLPQIVNLKKEKSEWRLDQVRRLPADYREDDAELSFLREAPDGPKRLRMVVRRSAAPSGVTWHVLQIE